MIGRGYTVKVISRERAENWAKNMEMAKWREPEKQLSERMREPQETKRAMKTDQCVQKLVSVCNC